MTADRPLTPREQRFVAEYLVDANATRAYRVVFPQSTYRAARVAASRLVAKANIAAEVKAARRAQQRRCRVGADAALRELAAVAFADIGDLVDPATNQLLPIRRIPLATRRALQSFRTTRERTTTRTTTARRGKATITTTVTVRECEIEFRF